MYTLDTNVIIYFLKDDTNVINFLREKTLEDLRFFISTIAEAELFGYPLITNEEILKIEGIFKTISIIPLDSQMARLSGYFKRKYNLSLPDAIVAATSYLTNSILVTRNAKDFKEVKEIKIQVI